jgi:prepilin-type N-terminal cleavage/methylation domain-containing protein
MSNSSRSNSHQSGVTVTELLVVVVVISVLAAFALIQPGATNSQLKRQNAAQELKSALERARFDSVKRRADNSAVQANVVVDTSSFTLTVDGNQDGVLNSSDALVTDISGLQVVIASEVGATLPVTISYNQRGEATASDFAGNTDPIFLVCNVSCSSPTVSNSNIVLVTATGTVNLLPGGSEIPEFSPPGGLTTVPPGTSINNTAAIIPTPTPTP